MEFDPRHWQLFKRWKDVPLGHGTHTIGSAGCLLCAVTRMLAQESGAGFVLSPPRVNRYLRDHDGFLGSNMVFNGVDGLGIVRFKERFDWIGPPSPDPPEKVEWIAQLHQQGHRVILQVDSSLVYGFQQHWVLVEEVRRVPKFEYLGYGGLVFLCYDSTTGYDEIDVAACFSHPKLYDLGTAIWGGVVYEVV